MLNIFSCYCPFWYLLWKDDFSNSLPIFSWFTDLFIKFFRVLSTLRLLHSYQLHNLSMISSYSVGRLFTFFDRILWYTEGSDYDEVQFFLLITCAFDVILCLPNPRSYRFTPIFLSKSFTVLTLTFGVLYPFWINFCIWCDGVKFHSVDIQFSQYYYWRDCWFSTECSWNSCQKSKIDHLYEGFFWVLSSISLIYMSVLMPLLCVHVCVSHAVMSDFLRPHGRYGAHQAALSMGFFRQGYWIGLPFPSPGDLPDPGIKPGSPTLHADSFTIWATSRKFWNWEVQVLHLCPSFSRLCWLFGVP